MPLVKHITDKDCEENKGVTQNNTPIGKALAETRKGCCSVTDIMDKLSVLH